MWKRCIDAHNSHFTRTLGSYASINSRPQLTSVCAYCVSTSTYESPIFVPSYAHIVDTTIAHHNLTQRQKTRPEWTGENESLIKWFLCIYVKWIHAREIYIYLEISFASSRIMFLSTLRTFVQMPTQKKSLLARYWQQGIVFRLNGGRWLLWIRSQYSNIPPKST